MYILISSDEDGEFKIEEASKKDILNSIKDLDYTHFVTKDYLKKEIDPAYWGEKILIIKGEIIEPRAKRVVDIYEID